MTGQPFRFDRRTYLRAMAALPAGLALSALGSEHVLATPPSFSVDPFLVGLVPRGVAVGDVNNDNKPDILVANFNSHSVSVLLNGGNGLFTNAPGSPIVFPVAAQRVRAADINGDGKLDMLVLDGVEGKLYTCLGNGDGTFGPIITSAVPTYTTDVVPIILNTSPHIGVAMTVGNSTTVGAANTVQIYSGDGLGNFTAKSHVGAGDVPIAISVSYDGGQTFVADANYNDGTMSLFSLQSNDSLTQVPGSPFTVGTQPACFPASLTFGHFGGPGTLGLACANYGDNTFSTFLLPNGGSWGFVGTYPTGQGPFGIAAGDVDGDGKVDLVIAAFTDNAIAIHPGNGNGTFGAKITVATGLDPADIAVGDFNRDGKPDIVTANQGGNNVTVATNTTTPFVNVTPFVGGITPVKGSSLGGTPFTIKGSGFQQGAVVRFHGAQGATATQVVVSPDGMTITGLTPYIGPISTALTTSVGIENPDMDYSYEPDISDAFVFTVPPAAIPGIQPSGPPPGTPPNPSPVVQPSGPNLSGGGPLPNPQSVRGGATTNPHGQVPAPAPPHR